MRRGFGVTLAVLALLLAQQAPAAAQGAPKTTTPIEHLVVLMQSGHSFDNYFGTYPGADGPFPGTCMVLSAGSQSREGCVAPFHLDERPPLDALDHDESIQRRQQHEGQMDGFIDVFRRQGRDGRVVMGYYDDRDLPYYWNVADRFTLFDRFHSSARAGGRLNSFFWVTGGPTPGRSERVPPGGYGDLPTIFDRLEAKGVAWKFYVEDYDPRDTVLTPMDLQSDQRTKVPLLNYARYVADPRLFGRIADLREYYADLERGTLPAVAYVVTGNSSERTPTRVEAGQRLVHRMASALARSDYWPRSAFLWTYDGWGGWYDHVVPPEIDGHGLGFRVPALLISPYSRLGVVNHAQLDYTGIIRFVQDNWGLEPLGGRADRMDGLASAFDFAAGPRAAELVPMERSRPATATPARVVYRFYGGALTAVVVAAGLVMLLHRRRAAA